MPELPEVETIRRQLLPVCQAQVIRTVELSDAGGGLLQNCHPEEFRQSLPGQSIRTLHRRGKFLIFECDSVFPVFHLGMSGIFLTDAAVSRYPQHIHVRLEFHSGKELFFQDMRRFGKIWLHRDFPPFPQLGVDPVSDPFSRNDLQQLLIRRDTGLKLFLMDQRALAGIGNIYASEILFSAGISPLRRTRTLSAAETAALYAAIRTVLAEAIERFGTTYSAYRTVDGHSGDNQHFLKVYQREGQPCVRCGREIEKIVLGSRSTFFCPQCQK